ncbi:MAG: tRNA pseudouridine synthase [Fibrobacterota bacterium]|jgi:tRNA pseudouridine55 synthase
MVLWDKPQGPSSHQALGILKKTFGTRRVGHAGTLDPPATGLLVCAVGKATRLLQEVEAREKEYVFSLRLGVETDTLDTAGQVLRSSEIPQVADIHWDALLPEFTGTLQQVPPAVSALKVDGVRAYERVRQGESLVLPAREVMVHEFSHLAEMAGNALFEGDPVFRVRCSKGTYVRSLARDLGNRIGCGACVNFLRRTAIGPWRVPDLPSEQTEEPQLVAVDSFFSEWPRFDTDASGREALKMGKAIGCGLADTELALAMEGEALACGRVVAGSFHPEILLVDVL